MRQTKRKIAEYYQGRYFTIETDPLGWKKGKLYPQFWRKLPPITLRYNHKSVSIIGNNCLTIFLKYGRFYLSQPNREIVEIKKTTKVIALDAGIRNFATMFDGENGFQITNTEDLTTLAKLSAYHGKLHKKAKNITEQHAEDGVIWQYNGRN